MRLIFAAALLLVLPPATDGDGSPSPSSTVPAFPLAGGNRSAAASACHLDLSSEMFGGVEEACGQGASLDRSRCCPVLAAWLFAAHSRSAFQFRPSSPPPETAGDMLPMMPEAESQQCAAELQSSLAARDISFPRPNASCDVVLCFCGIRLHEMGSLLCPAAFNVSGVGEGRGGRVRPTAAVRALERNCHNASYSGCTRCLGSLEKVGDEDI